MISRVLLICYLMIGISWSQQKITNANLTAPQKKRQGYQSFDLLEQGQSREEFSYCYSLIRNVSSQFPPKQWIVLNQVFSNQDTIKSWIRWFKFLYLIPLLAILVILLRCKWMVRKGNGEILMSRQEQIATEAEKYLQKNFTDPSLSRVKVAAYLNISSGYLGKIFLRNTGKSLPDYWNELRIRKAEKLLKSTDKKITDIAFETGFNSPHHFSKTFKAQKDTSPGEFRKMIQNNNMFRKKNPSF